MIPSRLSSVVSSLPWLAFSKGVIILVPVTALFLLLNHHLLVSTRVSYRYLPGKVARVISPKEPTTIIETADPAMRWRLTTDSLPFQVTVPRAVEKIRIRGRLAPGSQSVVWLKADGAKDADMQTLVSSSFLDALPWKRVTDGVMSLWMRDQAVSAVDQTKDAADESWKKNIRQYTSLSDFIVDPPDLSTVAATGVDRFALATSGDVRLATGGITLSNIFRGSHQFYVYANQAELKLTLEKTDRNRKKDSDTMVIHVARADELTARQPRWIDTIRVPDDGNEGANGPKGKTQLVEMTIPTPTPGTYFFDIQTTEDVTFTKLTSSSAMLSFANRVFLAEGPAYGEKEFRPVTVLTNGSLLSLAPAHEQGKQEVTVRGTKLALVAIGEQATASSLSGITSFTVARPDVKISSDGLIALAPAQIFPTAGSRSLTLGSEPNLEGINYIYAPYQPRSAGPITFDEEYAWSALDVKGKKVTFALEFPQLVSTTATIGLEQLETTLIRGPLSWQRAWQKITGQSKP